MKKRIISIVLSVIMLICIMPISSALADDPISVIVSADKTSVYRGDTVVFTVSIGAVEHLMGAEFKVDVPTGMTYIAGSATVADGLKETLGCQAADWTESAKKFTMYGEGDYSSNSPTKFLTFSCTVDMTATGSLVPDVYNVVVSNTSYEELLTNVNKEAATVTIALPATNIKLNKTELALASGAEETLSATVVPNNSTDKVSWESNNSDVASVDENGKVTAHKVGTAVITATAGEATDTCTVIVTCSHNYTEKAESQYLKSAATCISKAVYYKSCSVCGVKSTETFEYGKFNPDNHTGSTYLKDQKEATCQEEGYTGDTYCSDCNAKIKDGTVIEKSAHTPASVWTTNETHHWKECTVGCGNLIDKAEHSGGTATCTERAVCSICKVPYGTTTPHSYTIPQKDISYHWNKCANCNAIDMNVAHTFDQKVKNADTLKTAADCDDDAVYYYSCSCGQISTTLTFVDIGSATGIHTDADNKWETDGTKHWHTCECGEVIDEANHKGGTATCHDQAVCEVCGTAYGDLNADNHVYNVVKVIEPTCTAKGYTRHTCEYHSEKYYDDSYTDALGHKVVEWTVTKEATAEESGTKTGKCTVCGEEITAETGKLISKVEGDSAKVEAVGDTTFYENIILKTDKISDKLSDTDKADMQTKIEALKLAVENIKMAEIFDVSLFLRDKDASGNPIQDLKYEPNGKIRITMEVPESVFKNFKNVKLLHFLDDGTVEEVEYTLDGSKAVFETDSLSYFAFAGTPVVTDTGITNDNGTKNENNGQASSPKTGDSSNPIIWIAVLLVSALTVGTVSVYNRKKNCRACKK